MLYKCKAFAYMCYYTLKCGKSQGTPAKVGYKRKTSKPRKIFVF